MASVEKLAISGTQTTSTVPLPATNEAAHAALSTRELLCNIVAHLPFKGVLAATGVCREWRAALLSDPNIREGLFLKPEKVRLVLADQELLREAEKIIPFDQCQILGTTLPLLGRLFDEVVFAMKGITITTSAHRTPNSIRHMPTSTLDNANSFWRDMFVTQPPCSKVQISISTYRNVGTSGIRYPMDKLHEMNFRRAHGIKLGDLYDLIHSRLAKDFDHYFIELTVRDWISEGLSHHKYSIGDRIRCEVHNGEVRRPETPIAYDVLQLQ